MLLLYSTKLVATSEFTDGVVTVAHLSIHRFTCQKDVAAVSHFEESLFPVFQIILQNDVVGKYQ